MSTRCAPGDWVEIERVLLEPGDRSPDVPPETAQTPLKAWEKGFALDEAALGEEVRVETPAGRTVAGRLTAVSPAYSHTFGAPPAGLERVGRDLRARVAAYRETAPADEGGS